MLQHTSIEGRVAFWISFSQMDGSASAMGWLVGSLFMDSFARQGAHAECSEIDHDVLTAHERLADKK